MYYNYYQPIGKESGRWGVFLFAVMFALMASIGMFMPTSAATTETVSGDTAAGENEPGWLFNRDAGTSTPYEFTFDESSIGNGSLYVPPIDDSDPSNKFIGEYFLLEEMGNVDSISYDFMIGPGGDASDDNHFYMNVYANFGGSDPLNYYDCRYNIVPTTGSTSSFTTVHFNPDLSYPVTEHSSSPQPCSTVPANMGDNAFIRVVAFNVGDTSTTDAGLDGYYDNVVVNANESMTTFDFEPAQPTGEILSPEADSNVSGTLDLAATYDDGDEVNDDAIQWAVRNGTCAMGTNTVAGNVDGANDAYNWNGANFTSTLDVSTWDAGEYCFIFNPTDDPGENNVRETMEFSIVDASDKSACKKGGWEAFSQPAFNNQGDCVSWMASDHQQGNNPDTNHGRAL